MKKGLFILSGLAFLTAMPSYAYDIYNVSGNNYSYVFNVYKAGEEIVISDDKMGSPFELPQNYLSSLFTAAKKWTEVIKVPSNANAVTYAVFALNDYNAAASSLDIDTAEKKYRVSMVNATMNGLTKTGPAEVLDNVPFDGFINIGLGIDEENSGWQAYSGLHSLYRGKLPDMHTVMLHEIMHALGISTNVAKHYEDEGDDTYYFSEKDSPLSVYDKDLRIYGGDMDKPFDVKLEIVPKSFMAVGEGEDFDVIERAPYYIGQTAIKVLAGEDDYDKARQAIVDNGGLTNYSISYDEEGNYPKVYGLPIHNADDDEIDLSHIELRNSFMSHQSFRNWLVPMEAELAVLKDIGYNIELRKFFGKSYYLNNITDTFTIGYSEWDGNAYTGAPSTASQGVGLHIYGNNNNITQASDILSAGEGSFGVRVDGVHNKYTLKSGSLIQTNGKENLGLAVTWGKNHTISIEQGAAVKATGENGIAASFDFGNNLFGSLSVARGSYIYYDADNLLNDDPSEETADALVDTFNVAGTLEGAKAAIYISDNAHVKEINILQGAQINGDIISEWNSVKSGEKSKVQRFTGTYWLPVSVYDSSHIYYTDLNFDGAYTGTVKGNIIGNDEVYNTLNLNNAGSLTVAGDQISVNSLENSGTVNLDAADLKIQSGEILGDGTLNIGSALAIDEYMEKIENTVNFAEGASFSTMNGKAQDISINQLNADDIKFSFDIGDEFDLQNASVEDKATITQVMVDEKIAVQLADGAEVELFTDKNKSLDLGSSQARIYYNGNQFSLRQDDEDKSNLTIELTAEDVELADAVADETTANYIVTEDALTKDAGTVVGDYFEISGKNIDVDGHKGLVIDQTENSNGTVLKTGISGASDSDLTVQNGGYLKVQAADDDIYLGRLAEKAISLNNGAVELDADENKIVVRGDVVGTGNQADVLEISGQTVSLNKVQDINASLGASMVSLNNVSSNVLWQADEGIFEITDDDYLSSDGTNKIIGNGGTINLSNQKTSDVKLAQMTLNDNLNIAIDVDVSDFSADKFVFQKSSDLQTNNNLLMIPEITLMYHNEPLAAERYVIPFIAPEYHNENFLGNVILGVEEEILSPVFKYEFDYEENDKTGAFVLSRGSADNYDSYNPAVTAAPIAAQLGGYLAQINAYAEAFENMDMQILPIRHKTSAYFQNGLASGDVALFGQRNTIWLHPYAAYEKVGLKRGPKVRNNMYGAFAGDNSPMYAGRGWNYQYSIYAGYNGSRQRYDGILIRQNGGNLGVTGIWHKQNFFTALTANVGTSFAKAYTMYGHENFETLTAGIASKTGYNWRLFGDKFVVQPSYMMSYTFVDTLNYKNAADVSIKADPMHVLNIAPGVKFVYNMESGWQPYVSAQMAWNIFDKTNFKAQNVDMPEMSVKPYVEYGAGLQKRWGEKVSAYGQIMRRDGGRDGIALTAGFSWALGY